MTTVPTPTPLEFVEQLAAMPLGHRPGGGGWLCVCCLRSTKEHRGVVVHAPDCPVIRAQQVRDAAKGEVRELRALYGLARAIAKAPCPRCGHGPTNAPVSGQGPAPAESEDRGLVEAVARALDADTSLAVYGVPGWETTTEQENKRARIALDARAAHLSRTATVAAVPPVPGPLVGDEGLRSRIAGEMFRRVTPELRGVVVELIGVALAAVDAHLASRALRPATALLEFAQGFADEPCTYGDNCPAFSDGSAPRHGRCHNCQARAAIERDRAGGRR